MAHARQQIREAIVARLANLPTTGPRVYKTRIYPSGDEHLPGISIYTASESMVESGRDAAFREWRRLTITIEGRVKPPEGTDPDDQLDDIAAEVESALMSEHTLGNRLKGLRLQNTSTAFDDSLERPVGLVLLTWEAKYCVDARDPSVLPYAQ